MYNNLSVEDKANYASCKKNLAFCNLSSFMKITVYGPSAIDLVNSFSIRDITKIKENAFYTILLKKSINIFRKVFLGEVLIIKLSPIKYLIVLENGRKAFKALSKCKRKFPLVTVEESSFNFSLLSFHGEKSNSFFETYKASNIYKVYHQKYPYYILLTANINKFQVIDNFKNLGFFEISLETRNIFLYNNTVILRLENVKRKYKLNTYISLYESNNLKIKKSKRNAVLVKHFEATKNMFISRGMKIHNNKRHPIGYVHNFYRLPNKKYPYLLGIVKVEQNDKMAIILNNKTEEVIVKEFVNY